MATTDIFALRSPAGADPADVPTDMGELASDVETALMAIIGQERTVARAEMVFEAGGAAATYIFSVLGKQDPTSDLASVVMIQPSSLWLPSQDLLLPVAGLKSVLTLYVVAVSGETDPALASGEVIGKVGLLSGNAGGSAGQLKMTFTDQIDSGASQTFKVNAPVVTGNGADDRASGTYTVDAAADIHFANLAAGSQLALALETSALYSGLGPTRYALHLTHKYVDID